MTKARRRQVGIALVRLTAIARLNAGDALARRRTQEGEAWSAVATACAEAARRVLEGGESVVIQTALWE